MKTPRGPCSVVQHIPKYEKYSWDGALNIRVLVVYLVTLQITEYATEVPSMTTKPTKTSYTVLNVEQAVGAEDEP